MIKASKFLKKALNDQIVDNECSKIEKEPESTPGKLPTISQICLVNEDKNLLNIQPLISQETGVLEQILENACQVETSEEAGKKQEDCQVIIKVQPTKGCRLRN